MPEPNWDKELYRQVEESHVGHFGHALFAGGVPLGPEVEGVVIPAACVHPDCPRCGEHRYEPVRDLKGDACEGCAERDAEGDVIESEEDVL